MSGRCLRRRRWAPDGIVCPAPSRNIPLAGLFQGMEYSRTDKVLFVITALAVAAFVSYMVFGPMQ
jgi:hypothetical protein